MSGDIGMSPLRAMLEKTGLPLKDVTVLAAQNDPFRLDTDANHRDGAWLAEQVERLGLSDRVIHLRGLHYALIDSTRPNGKPSTPLKATEKRADKWQQEMQVQQTEIDALAALRPELLTELAVEAIHPFYDQDLDLRVRRAELAWEQEAQERLDDALSPELRAEFRSKAVERLDQLQEQIDALQDELVIDPGDIELPEIELPQAVVPDPPTDPPLIDSSWPFTEQCQRLIESKNYGGKP